MCVFLPEIRNVPCMSGSVFCRQVERHTKSRPLLHMSANCIIFAEENASTGKNIAMKRSFFVIFLFTSLTAMAQGRDPFQEFCHRADSFLSQRYYKLSVDTNYLVRPMGRWRLMTRYNLSGAGIDTQGTFSETEYRAHASAKSKSTISFVGSYTGITLAMTFNPGALVGWYKDYEFNTNEYYNRMGVDITYQRAKNFRGWTERDEEPRKHIGKDLISLRYFNFNYYYAFNHHRFSYPAAFCHSYIQKKSAGSFMLGGSFQWQKLHVSIPPELGGHMQKLKVCNLAVGAGYGYNMVIKKNWLLHLSTLPSIIIFRYSRAWNEDSRQTMDPRFPEFIITGRLALIRNFGRYFAGGTMVYNYTRIGDRDELAVSNTKWRVRTFIGVRF